MLSAQHAPLTNRPITGLLNKSALVNLFVLLLVSLGPSASRYELELASFAAGLIAVSASIWVLGLSGIFKVASDSSSGHVAKFLVLILFVIGHIFFTYWVGQRELERSLTSLAALGFILYSARGIGFTLFRDDGDQHIGLQLMLPIFAVISIFGLLGIAPYSELASDRPLYPFTEPSHFALAVMPFLIYSVVTNNQLVRLGILAGATVAVILLKSLSLAIGVLLAGICCLQGTYFVAFFVGALGALRTVDLTYFTDRLDFAYGNENLSMLVYRQGIELIQKSLVDTYGLGIGFQRLGFTDLFTPTSNIIFGLTKADLNLQDGGFLAAKLITEFGAFGVMLVAAYLFLLAKGVLVLRKVSNQKLQLQPGTVFAYACVVGFAVEMFVRGAGYFTPTALLAVAAIPYVRKLRLEKERAT